MNNLTASQKEIAKVLVKKGYELFARPYEPIAFTEDLEGHEEADKLLNDLKNYPHAFVLGCIMDKGVRAKRAWIIPYKVSLAIGGFEFEKLEKLSLNDCRDIFNNGKNGSLHRYKNKAPLEFYKGIQKIKEYYGGDASKIWSDIPPSSEVVCRFEEFYGVGQKVSTMATNLLAKEFKVPMKDYTSIDISVDVQIKKIFKRLGLVHENAEPKEIIAWARAINPEFPGIFDSVCWELGSYTCFQTNPKCSECFLEKECAFRASCYNE
ncbi:MAG: hypothetical protein PHU28_08465 [Methanosarcinaceae archaeon]|nr:hypothetical protein [Methanosarcinaceae archaeon]